MDHSIFRNVYNPGTVRFDAGGIYLSAHCRGILETIWMNPFRAYFMPRVHFSRLWWVAYKGVYLPLKIFRIGFALCQGMPAVGAEGGSHILLINTCFLWNIKHIRSGTVVLALFFWT